MTLFTGSSRVAEKLAGDLKGRIKLEDAGFDWKILGPDVDEVYTINMTMAYRMSVYVLNVVYCPYICLIGGLRCVGL